MSHSEQILRTYFPFAISSFCCFIISNKLDSPAAAAEELSTVLAHSPPRKLSLGPKSGVHPSGSA